MAPRNKRRKLWLSVAALPALAAAALTGAWLWRVDLAAWFAARELSRLGFAGADIAITAIEWGRIELASARLGPDFKAGKTVVLFDISDLRRRRYETMRIGIDGLELDLSTPRAGALGKLRALAGSRPPAQALALPRITLSDARILGRAGPAAADLRFDADLETVEGESRFRLIRARVADDRDDPLFFPLDVAVEGMITGTRVTIDAEVRGADGEARVSLSGNHDLKTASGAADWRLSPVNVGDGGLSPSRLSPLAIALDGLRARLRASGSLGWTPAGLEGQVHAFVSGAGAAVGGTTITDAGGEFRASLATANGKIRWLAENGSADITANGRTVRLRALSASGTLDDWGATAAARLKGATLGTDGFAEANVVGNAVLSGFTRLKGEFVAGAADGRVRTTTLVEHDLANGRGKALAVLAPVTFRADGLQPRRLSRLVTLPGTIDGTVSASANLQWQPAGVSGDAFVSLSDGGFRDGNTRVRGLTGEAIVKPFKAGEPLAISLRTEGAEVSTGGREWALGPMDVDARWKDGNFEARGNVEALRHVALEPFFMPLGVSFTARGTTAGVTFDADISQNRAKRLSASGRYDPEKSDLRASLATVPLRFDDGGLTPAQISPRLALADSLSGQIEATADIRLRGNDLTGTARAEIRDLDIRKADTRIEGLTGTIALAQLMPPLTAGTQNLRAGRIVAGTVFPEPAATYRVERSPIGPLPRLRIETAGIGIAGGRATLPTTVIDPNREVHDIDIDLAGVDLRQLMALIDIEGISAEGRLSGRLPLRLTRDTVFVRKGTLRAAGPGVLRIRSEAARRALAGGGEQVELVLEVLRDFRYSTLALTLERLPDGSDVVRLTTEGNNPAVRKGRTFRLNVNLETNLDKLLAFALAAYRLSDEALRATLGGTSGK